MLSGSKYAATSSERGPFPTIYCRKETYMKIAKLVALSGVALSLSVGCGSEADALVKGDVTEARKAVGP